MIAEELQPPYRCPACLAGYWAEKALCRGGHPRRGGTRMAVHEVARVVAAKLVQQRVIARRRAVTPRRKWPRMP